MPKSGQTAFADQPANTSAGSSTVRLRVLATSDLHMHVTAYDYSGDQPSQDVGLSRTASLITAARAEAGAQNCILVDNGDFLQGNALGDFMAQMGDARGQPMIAAMNHLGYDVVNLGNHEFSHGIGYLQACLGEARFLFVSANTCYSVDGAQFVAPWVILDRDLTDDAGAVQRVRIGITGILPPQTTMWDKTSINGQLRMGPMRDTLAQMLPDIRAAGADVVVVLAHCGIGSLQGEADPFAENMGAEIAALPGVDALVMGHVHLVYPQPEGPAMPRQVPAVMAGAMGSHLGVIDLHLHRNGKGWHVAKAGAEARPITRRDGQGNVVATTAPDHAVEQIAATAHHNTLSWMRKPIAQVDRPLHSYFALISACPVVQIVNLAKMDYVTRRLAQGEWAGVPVLSSNAPARAGARGGAANFSFIPPGDLLIRHAADIYPHTNSITAMHLTGAEIRAWLEISALVFRQIPQGVQDEPLLCASRPPFHFDTISGITYRIDLSRSQADHGQSRVVDLYYQGRPVADGDRFILAMNSYRASGSGGFATQYADRIILSDPKPCRDMLVDYLAARGGHLPDLTQGWRFVPMAGTTVLFDSAPEAADHLGDLPDLQIDPLQLTADGFRRFRLHL